MKIQGYISAARGYPQNPEMKIQGYIRAARGYPQDPEIMKKGIQGRLPCIRKNAGMLEQGIQDQDTGLCQIIKITDQNMQEAPPVLRSALYCDNI